ncbi:hypothetical protein A0H81_08669 [Grifola frondosa]|uniref:Uncharacterized protein n=1 Tax=Grifola frondosa TaxID=5627 RepID=A0A1C7M3J2_GRIFR|nr:hypothetical protein A0H81_08669 [Grifola frondosa]
MTPRPPLSHKSRPLSAIFIGSNSSSSSSPPAIPDLPEPPSPGSSSSASGLPSPPATNSTGSGSTGKGSTNARSVRQKTASRSDLTTNMSNGVRGKILGHVRTMSATADDDDDVNDYENDEDHTARLSNERKRSFRTAPSDNVSALQRVKSLAERNRMVLDKLSSISRLGSPVPSSNPSPSPVTPLTAGTSSSSSTTFSRISSSRLQSSYIASTSGRRREPPLSGSETERESQRVSSRCSSSDEYSSPSACPENRAPSSLRQRRISAPASPGKIGRPPRDRDRGSSPGPSRTPRKRVSMAMSVDEPIQHVPRDDDDVTAAALAAVASSRRSPTGSSGKKARQPLPKEFRDKHQSDDIKPSGEPTTPHRSHDQSVLGRASPSPRAAARSYAPNSTVTTSPRRPTSTRYSTVRELTRKHQTRWMSEDLTSNSVDGKESLAHTVNGNAGGRRQGARGGSSEGLFGAGRSLVTEGLRAAGLARRKDGGEDIFTIGTGNTEPLPPRRTRSTGNTSVINGDLEQAGPSHRINEGVGPPSGQRDSRNRTTTGQRTLDRHSYTGLVSRPGTSMAALHHENPELQAPRTAPPVLRSYRSTHTLPDQDRIRLETPQQHQVAGERSHPSPYANLRTSSATSGAGRDPGSDHRRLMLESLAVFESHLSRLPPMGQTTTSTIPELFQSAQHLVHALDKLNGMLKAGTNKALEGQIDAEVGESGDNTDLVEMWRRIGAENRDALRVSDEIVRNITGFLLGVGRVLRESTSTNSPHPQHTRKMSVEDETKKRSSPDVAVTNGERSSDGRRSRETRRSWDPSTRETGQLLTRIASRERAAAGSRAASSLKRNSATSSSEGRSIVDAAIDQAPQTARSSLSTYLPTSSIRRLYTPREQRATSEVSIPLMPSMDSQETINGDYEPSPTPASRHPHIAHVAIPERRRALPPLAVPPSLPSLPSESILSRSSTTASEKTNGRKASSNSNITVRPDATIFHPVKPPNATTAITVDTGPFPMVRTGSSGSGRTNGVTFSRPSTVSVSALNDLQQQHERDARRRTTSSVSSTADDPSILSSAVIASPMSGSETERDTRRRTMDVRSRTSLLSSKNGEDTSVHDSVSLRWTVDQSVALVL